MNDAGQPSAREIAEEHRRIPAAWLLGAAAGIVMLAVAALLWASLRRAPTSEQLHQEIRRAMAAQDWKGGASAVVQLIAPLNAGAGDLLLAAQFRSAQGQDEAALRALERVAPNDPKAAEAWVTEGSIQLRRLRLRPAEAAFRRALAVEPNLAGAQWGLAMVSTMQMRRDAVLESFRALAALAPLSFEQALVWTQVRCFAWDLAKAVPQLRNAWEADHDDPWVRRALAEGLRQLGELDEAEAVLGQADESDPDSLLVRAWIALDRKDDAAAERVLALGPSDHAGLAQLRGRLALSRRDWERAVHEFRIALRDGLDRRESVAGLIQALRMTGKSDDADKLAAQLRRLDTLTNLVQTATERTRRNDPALLRALGAACEALGYLPEARAWYLLAISRDPTNSDAQAGVHRLTPK